MRVLIAAGGTAGHINPALAIAGAIKKADPSAEIHFAGRKEGMEYRLVTQVKPFCKKSRRTRSYSSSFL